MNLIQNPDLINGMFEISGAVFLWCDVARLRRDKCVRGVYWPARLVYALWGVWNMFYYPALGQSLSFFAGFGVVSANVVWCALAITYALRERRDARAIRVDVPAPQVFRPSGRPAPECMCRRPLVVMGQCMHCGGEA